MPWLTCSGTETEEGLIFIHANPTNSEGIHQKFEWQVDKNFVPTEVALYCKLLCDCFKYLLKVKEPFLTTSNVENKF